MPDTGALIYIRVSRETIRSEAQGLHLSWLASMYCTVRLGWPFSSTIEHARLPSRCSITAVTTPLAARRPAYWEYHVLNVTSPTENSSKGSGDVPLTNGVSAWAGTLTLPATVFSAVDTRSVVSEEEFAETTMPAATQSTGSQIHGCAGALELVPGAMG